MRLIIVTVSFALFACPARGVPCLIGWTHSRKVSTVDMVHLQWQIHKYKCANDDSTLIECRRRQRESRRKNRPDDRRFATKQCKPSQGGFCSMPMCQGRAVLHGPPVSSSIVGRYGFYERWYSILQREGKRTNARTRLIQYISGRIGPGVSVGGSQSSILLTESSTLSGPPVIILGDHIARILTNSDTHREKEKRGNRKRSAESSPFPYAFPFPASLRPLPRLPFSVCVYVSLSLALSLPLYHGQRSSSIIPHGSMRRCNHPSRRWGVVGQRWPFPWTLLVHRCTQTAHQATHNTPLIPIKRRPIRKWTNVWAYAQAPPGSLALAGQTPHAIQPPLVLLASDPAFAGCISRTDLSGPAFVDYATV